MQVVFPFWAIAYIINDAFIGDELTRSAFTHVFTQFKDCDDSVGDGHGANYTPLKIGPSASKLTKDLHPNYLEVF